MSVRDADEAKAALEGGADLIDVKEPNHGSLGRASLDAIREILEAVGGRRPVSAALGELVDFDPTACDWTSLHSLSFMKLGLSKAPSDWQALQDKAWAQAPTTIARVAVIYVDHVAAEAPCPDEILNACRALRISAVLWDTHDKSGGRLSQLLSIGELARQVHWAKSMGLTTVFAGSLQASDFFLLRKLAPDYFAVRGSACSEGRSGRIRENLVRDLKLACSDDPVLANTLDCG